MVQFALRLDFLITLWHSEQVKVSKLWKVTGVSYSLLAGGVDTVNLYFVLSSLPAGFSNTMIVSLVSLSAAQGCAFKMCFDISDSTGCSVVV